MIRKGGIKVRTRKFGFPVTMQRQDDATYVTPDGSAGWDGQSDGQGGQDAVAGQDGQDAVAGQGGQGGQVWWDEERAELKSLKQLDINAFNEAAEQAFVKMLVAWLGEVGQVTVKEVLAEASFELDISTETAKRYLLKHTARRAEFAVNAGRVVLK